MNTAACVGEPDYQGQILSLAFYQSNSISFFLTIGFLFTQNFLGCLESRSKVSSTIFCSQFDVPGWHENLYDPTLVDAICDRIIYVSYTIRVEGDSMRKRKGITE